jgi:nucleoside-diphosphate-sugar epimerase
VPLSDGQQRRDFTYVDDVADGLLRLGLCRPVAGTTLNLATGKLHSVRDFVQIAARVLRIPDRQLEFGALPPRPEEMAHEAVAVDRLRAALGWVPDTTIEEGVARTARFLDLTDT